MLALGAPAGLLLVRLGRRLSLRSLVKEVKADLQTYLYSGTATAAVFALFGGVLGRQADRLAQLATTDPLTGLANSRAFHDRLRLELGRVARHHEALSVLLIDVDGLKRVNDRHGHDAGDVALRTVAGAIRSDLREIDLGARVGGDEFAVLAPGTDGRSAAVLAERLRARVAMGMNGFSRRRTTISVGVASTSGDGEPTALELLAAADEALYRAKRRGGNRLASAG
jgi:diguanylate cyclase (GGDEF)-like protein